MTPRSALASPFAIAQGATANVPPNFHGDCAPTRHHRTPPRRAYPSLHTLRLRPPPVSRLSRPRAAALTAPAPAPSLYTHSPRQNVFGTLLPAHALPRSLPLPLMTPTDLCCIVGSQQDAQEEECEEGNPVLPHGLRRLGHRPHHLRQHAVRPAGPHPQGIRRSLFSSHAGGSQDQAHHRGYVAPRLARDLHVT